MSTANAHPTIEAIFIAFALDAAVWGHTFTHSFGARRLGAQRVVGCIDANSIITAVDRAGDPVVALGVFATLCSTAGTFAAQ